MKGFIHQGVVQSDGSVDTSQSVSDLTIRPVEDNDSFEIMLNGKEVIERKDLLEGVTPILKWLINVFVSSPAYYGILADATINIAHESIKGIGNYEMMFFRKT